MQRVGANDDLRLFYVACPTSLRLQSANAIQTWTTLRELRRARPDTVAVVPRWPGEPSRFSEVGARHLLRPAVGKLSRFYRSTLWYYAERSIFAFMSAALALLEGLRGRWPEVVYVRDSVAAFWWATTLGPALAVPVIYEAHDLESTNPSRAKERWAEGLVRAFDRGALGQSTLVVSLTEDFRQLLAHRNLRDAGEIEVIPDAFDDEVFRPGDRAKARRDLGLPAERPLVVYAGMTFAYRGLDRLVSAFRAVLARHPKAALAFVGGRAPEVEALAAQARELGLQAAVRLVGPLPQEGVRPWLQAADVLTIPDTVTDVSASPLKLFEYLAMERVVILPDIPALREVLPESVGYYFRRGDEGALSAALLRALGDPLRSDRERAGREAVIPHTYAARAARVLAAAGRARALHCA
jgi:glycosyltransferase involved in cell wall biosynthesis